MSNISKGIAFMLLQCVALSFIMAIMRQLSFTGLPVSLVMFWQNVFALSFVIIICAYKKNFPKTKKIKWHIMRSMSGYASGSLLAYGLSVIPLNTATAISFTGPLFTTIFAVLILKEKISSHRVTGLLIGFAGTLVVLRPGTEHFDLNYFFVIGTAALWGVTDIIIKILNRTESLISILLYTSISMMFIATPLAIIHWQPITNEQYLWLFLLACFHLLNFGSATKAYSYADLSVLMPFVFSRLIFSSIFAFFLFAEMLDVWTIIGSFIIVFGSVYVVYKEKKKQRIKVYED